jgi:hypothetical protein
MRIHHLVLSCAAAVALISAGCSCDPSDTDGDGGADRPDGTVDPTDGGGLDGGPLPDGTVLPPDGSMVLPDGRVIGGPCVPAICAGRTYACGNCLDDDSDGIIDALDPGCIGACDASEDVYDLEIPGGDTPTCLRECYYDADQGPGNDGCEWNESCDPLEPDPLCPFTGPGGPVRCPETQDALCHDVCLPLVPNGCDCFGCCELPAGSGSFVFLGSTDAEGNHTCTPDTIADTTSCRPCTPVPGCENTCERCELCLGRTELPADCFPPPPVDAGPPIDGGGEPYDAGPPVDAGPPSERCAPGVQACGLPSDPACPESWYCLTGCCIFFG